MKRFAALLTAVLIIICAVPPARAETLTDNVPSAPQFSAFWDMGTAKAALFDLDSGCMLYSKGGDDRVEPGSLTVIMTALLLIENTGADEWDEPLPPLEQVNSVWSERAAQMGLQKGSSPTRRDLLYGLLLLGAGDAAFVTENLVSGSEADFVAAMNEKAEELGLIGTEFQNGYGISSNAHYTTANDLAKLTLEAMRNESFAEAVSAGSFVLSPSLGGSVIMNTNSALADGACIGVRVCAESERRHSVIVASKVGEARLCAVVLEASSDQTAYSYADMLISEGMASYMALGGLRSFTPGNALMRAKEGASLYEEPRSAAAYETVEAGQTLRAIGSHEDASGVFLCVYRGGRVLWARAEELELVCYVDDVFIDNGDPLSRDNLTGEGIEAAVTASTRHEIKSIGLTVTLFDGTPIFSEYCRPNSHNTVSVSGTGLAEKVADAGFTAGSYFCTTEVEAEARLPGLPTQTIVKSQTSVFSVASGGECVSYNANTGSGAPVGEVFIESFVIPEETPQKAGYRFACWSDSPTGAGRRWHAGETVTPESSLTLYAVWENGVDKWGFEGRALYENALILEGTATNEAGITGLRLVISRGGETVREINASLCDNTVGIGDALITEPVVLEPGDYTAELFGSAGGGQYEKLMEQDLTAGESTIPTEKETPTPDPGGQEQPQGPSFSLAGIPIWIWFMIGIIVVIVLIVIIIKILRSA